jgi:hypothetical protein
VTPLYPQKLALTSPTGGGRSVGIVRSRTKATEFIIIIIIIIIIIVVIILIIIIIPCVKRVIHINPTKWRYS